MLSHYWTGDEDARLRQEQIKDWVGDLEHFGAATVAGACDEWRKTETKRPLPANIILICDRKRNEAVPSRPVANVSRIERIMPSAETVRDNWRTLKYWDLSDAEKALFRDTARVKIASLP